MELDSSLFPIVGQELLLSAAIGGTFPRESVMVSRRGVRGYSANMVQRSNLKLNKLSDHVPIPDPPHDSGCLCRNLSDEPAQISPDAFTRRGSVPDNARAWNNPSSPSGGDWGSE